jgi:hypothetical protein
MGHTVEECGDGIHDPRTCEWGEWLLWGSEQSTFVSGGGGNMEGRGGGGRSGGRGGRGGRQGRGGRDGFRREGDMHTTSMDHTQQDPATENPNARKRLVLSDGTVNIRGQALPNLAGRVAGTVLLLENNGEELTQGASNTPGKAPIVKRRRQDGAVRDDDMVTDDQAASFGEDRRSQ